MKKIIALIAALGCAFALLSPAMAEETSTGDTQSILDNLSEPIYFLDPDGNKVTENTDTYRHLDVPESYITYVEEQINALNSPLTVDEVQAINDAIDEIQALIEGWTSSKYASSINSCEESWLSNSSHCVENNYTMGAADSYTVSELQTEGSVLWTRITNRIIDLAASMDVQVSISGRGITGITIIDNRIAKVEEPVRVETVTAEEDAKIELTDELSKALDDAANGAIIDEEENIAASNEVIVPVTAESEVSSLVVDQNVIETAAQGDVQLTFDVNNGGFEYSLELTPEKNMDLNIAVTKNLAEEISESFTEAEAEKIDNEDLVLDFAHSGELPASTKVVADITDYYSGDDTESYELTLYHVVVGEDGSVTLVPVENLDIRVEDGKTKVIFTISSCSKYVFKKTEKSAGENTPPVVAPSDTTETENNTPASNGNAAQTNNTAAASTILKNTGAQE